MKKRVEKTDAVEAANLVLGWIQNIQDEEDAKDFVRIALDAMEAGAAERGQEFDRIKVLCAIRETDKRMS